MQHLKTTNMGTAAPPTGNLGPMATTQDAHALFLPTIQKKEKCCLCKKDLLIYKTEFSRATCCGQVFHKSCHRNLQNSKRLSKCIHCHVKYPTTDKEIVSRIYKWVKKGEAWALSIMAKSYRDGNYGVKKSLIMAVKMFEKAVEQGDPAAMCELALMYDSGEGVAQSYKQAADLYGMAAVQGDVRAQVNLGNMYYHGKDIEQSFPKAIALFTLAANQGNAGAQYNLGNSYYRGGEGVDQSNVMAREWWTKAVAQGLPEAIDSLKQLDDLEGKITSTGPSRLCCASCGESKPKKSAPCAFCGKSEDCQFHQFLVRSEAFLTIELNTIKEEEQKYVLHT